MIARPPNEIPPSQTRNIFKNNFPDLFQNGATLFFLSPTLSNFNVSRDFPFTVDDVRAFDSWRDNKSRQTSNHPTKQLRMPRNRKSPLFVSTPTFM
jgi:hypothetical protein